MLKKTLEIPGGGSRGKNFDKVGPDKNKYGLRIFANYNLTQSPVMIFCYFSAHTRTKIHTKYSDTFIKIHVVYYKIIQEQKKIALSTCCFIFMAP
jgi:hypothetical protein